MFSVKDNTLYLQDDPCYSRKEMDAGNLKYYFFIQNISQLEIVNTIVKNHKIKPYHCQVVSATIDEVPKYREFMLISEQIPDSKWYDSALCIKPGIKYIRIFDYANPDLINLDINDEHHIDENYELIQ